MKFQKSLASTFAAAALAVGLSQATPAFAQDVAPGQADTQQAIQTTAQAGSLLPSINFNPVVPIEVLGGMGGIAAILLLLAARQKMRGAWIRAAASSALVVALANPTNFLDSRPVLPTQVAIVVDNSTSQTLDGRDISTKAAQAALARELTGLDNVEVRLIEAGGPQNGVPVDETKLFAGLQQGIADIPPDQLGAVIFITDGRVDDLPENVEKLTGGAPLHVLVTGHANEFDRRVVLEKAPAFGVIKEPITIKFHVADDGAAPANARVKVTISADGAPIGSQQVKPGQSAEMTVNIPHGGANIIELSTDAVPGEVTDANNRIATTVQGVREKMQVLLVSGEPNAGERTWRNLLTSDPSVELVHFTIMRTPGKEDDAPLNELSLISLPMREIFEHKLKDFDLVILDRYQYRGILPPPYLADLAKYVNNGGALLVAAGPGYAGAQSLFNTPLTSAMPAAPTGHVDQEGFQPKVSDAGQRHPVTRDLQDSGADKSQWGRWFRIVDVKDVHGEVLMKGPGDRPLLILNHEAKGRVAMLLSDTSWLWARGFEGGGPYAELLERTAHWLLKDPALEEEALRARVEDGALVVERQTMSDSVSPVTIQTPSGKTINVTLEKESPGLWRATIPAKELGLYSVLQGDQNTFASAGTASPHELANTISTTDTLEPATAKTGGKISRLADPDDPAKVNVPKIELRSGDEAMSGDDWIGVRKTTATRLGDSQEWPLLRGLLGLSLLFGALGAAWHREAGGFSRFSGRKAPSSKNNGPKGP